MNNPLIKRRALSLVMVLMGAATVVAQTTRPATPAAPAVVAPQTRPTRIACVGDSITFGVGVGNDERATAAYPGVLGKLLGDAPAVGSGGYDVRNFGNSGTTLAKQSGHPYWKVPEFLAAQAFAPDVVIVLLGTNDSNTKAWAATRDDFAPTLRELVAVFRALPGHPKVLLGLPPPVFGPEIPKRGPPLNGGVTPLIKQVAREVGADTVDFNGPLAEHPEWMPDGLHPNADGARAMAWAAFEAVIGWHKLRATWQVLRADSAQRGEGAASHVLDGDLGSHWHTAYTPQPAPYPHEIDIGFGRSLGIRGLRYTPRQGGLNGRIKAYEVAVADSPAGPFTLVASGDFAPGDAAQVVVFKQPVQAAIVRLRALSEQRGGPWAAIAELDFLPAPAR